MRVISILLTILMLVGCMTGFASCADKTSDSAPSKDESSSGGSQSGNPSEGGTPSTPDADPDSPEDPLPSDPGTTPNEPKPMDPMYTPSVPEDDFVVPEGVRSASITRKAVIGGGGAGSNFWKKVMELSGKTKSTAKAVVIPTAGRDAVSNAESYTATMKAQVDNVTTITLSTRSYTTKELFDIVMEADIIFIGGGQSEYMMATWKQFKLDKILYYAYCMGKVCCGGSAGCMCWTYLSWNDNYEFHDEDSTNKTFTWFEGIDAIPFYVGPHYNNSDTRWADFTDELKTITQPKYNVAYAIDENAALVVINDKTTEAVRENSARRIIEYTFSNGAWSAGTTWADSKFNNFN